MAHRLHNAHVVARAVLAFPAGPVTVTRHTRHYRRSVNGAWLGDADSTARHTVDPLALRDWTLGDSWLEVVWSDGVRETVFPPRSVVGPGYSLEPIGARVAALFEGVTS